MRKHEISVKRLDELHEPGVAKDNVAHFIDFIESISTKGELQKPRHSLRWHLERNKEKAFEWGEGYAKDTDDIVERCLVQFESYGMATNAKGLIYVERALNLPNDGINTEYYDYIKRRHLSVGECWSWKPGNAKPYCSNEYGHSVVLKGWVSPDSINWQETMYINVYHMKGETEIRLSDASGTVVEIDEVEVDGRTIPFDGPRLTRADAVKYAHNPFHVAAKYRESGMSPEKGAHFNGGDMTYGKPFAYNGRFYFLDRDMNISPADMDALVKKTDDLYSIFKEIDEISENSFIVRFNGGSNIATKTDVGYVLQFRKWYEYIYAPWNEEEKSVKYGLLKSSVDSYNLYALSENGAEIISETFAEITQPNANGCGMVSDDGNMSALYRVNGTDFKVIDAWFMRWTLKAPNNSNLGRVITNDGACVYRLTDNDRLERVGKPQRSISEITDDGYAIVATDTGKALFYVSGVSFIRVSEGYGRISLPEEGFGKVYDDRYRIALYTVSGKEFKMISGYFEDISFPNRFGYGLFSHDMKNTGVYFFNGNEIVPVITKSKYVMCPREDGSGTYEDADGIKHTYTVNNGKLETVDGEKV